MPNWCYNSLTILGTADDLQYLNELAFDFQKIHPCEFIHGEEWQEGWYDWCIKYWGCKWSAREVEIDYVVEDTQFTAQFQTPWNTPDAILTFLTKQYPSVTIVNEWYDETYEIMGINVYSHGSVLCKYIEPTDYTHDALAAFSDSHSWFSYIDYADVHEESEEENNDLKTVVEVVEYTKTYEELIA
jgi:hypothetical protein